MNIDGLLKKAKKLEQRGAAVEASELYQSMLAQFPDNPRIVQASDRFRKKTAPSAAQSVPNSALAPILNDVLAHFNKGEFQYCVVKGEEALKTYPEEGRLWLVTGLSYAQLGQLDLAETHLQTATHYAADLADAHYNLGYVRKLMGRKEDAISAYQHCLKIQPTHENALNNLGNLYLDKKSYSQSEECFRTLIFHNPNSMLAYANLGNVLKDQQRYQEALESYNKTLNINPNFTDALYNSALVLEELDQENEAIERYQQVLALQADHAEALNNLGKIFFNREDYENSKIYLNKSVAANPDNASVHINIGCLAFTHEELDDAIAHFKTAVELDPNNVDALTHLGNSYFKSDDFDTAKKIYYEALQANPESTDALNNLGNLYRAQFELDKAKDYYLKAIASNPHYFKAYNNLGIISRIQGRYEDTLDYYDKSLAIFPSNYECLWNKALLLMAMGHIEDGVPLYENRWKTNDFNSVPLVTDKPRWTGSSTAKLLLWAEQGIGDEVMFGSMLLDVFALNQNLTVEIEPRLIDLFKRSFGDKITYIPRVLKGRSAEDTEALDFEEHVPMGSLLSHVGISDADFRRRSQAYLRADPKRVERIRNKLTSHNSDIVIGISWGTRNKKSQKIRNCDLAEILTHLAGDNVRFVNLQYGEIDQDIATAEAETGLSVIVSDEMNKGLDIDGQAALICACDHVVSIDNSTVHFAGALGVDTHVMLHVGPDWRWGIDRDKSYWYSSVHLYHQSEIGDYGPMLSAIRQKLNLS